MTAVARYIWFVLLAAMFVGVYHMKNVVDARDRELGKVKREVSEELEAIQVLRAEWAHLNRPEYLRRLAAGRFDYQPIRAGNMATFERAVERLTAESRDAAEAAAEAADRVRRRSP
jgi:hypothetical protein